VDNGCRRCGGELRQAAILANYKSFVVSLMRCAACGATFERKENAHRPAEESGGQVGGSAGRVGQPRARLRRPRAQQAPDPARAREAPTPPAKRHQPAKRIERPFNVRVIRRSRERQEGET
jgi:hypothetical protein